MFRGTLRTLFAGLALLFDAIGWQIDSNGRSETTSGEGGDIGWHIDPDG